MITPTEAGNVLRDADRDIWEEYVRLELDGVRREAIPVLAKFVSNLESYPLQERTAFADKLVAAVCEGSTQSFPIRHPLFDRIVLPVLLDRYDRNEIGSARVLLQFYHQLHGGGLCKDIIGERDLSQWALLDRAILQEPESWDLQMRWLDMNRDWFEYATHEVPSGILYGHNGATVAECEDLLAHVDQFETRSDKLDAAEQYREEIRKWRYYFSSYREYLLQQERYHNFERFLEEHPLSSKTGE